MCVFTVYEKCYIFFYFVPFALPALASHLVTSPAPTTDGGHFRPCFTVAKSWSFRSRHQSVTMIPGHLSLWTPREQTVPTRKEKSIFSKQRRVAWNSLLHNPENTIKGTYLFDLTRPASGPLPDFPDFPERFTHTFRPTNYQKCTHFSSSAAASIFFPSAVCFPHIRHSQQDQKHVFYWLLFECFFANNSLARSTSSSLPAFSFLNGHTQFYSGGGQNDVITLNLPAMKKTRNWKLFHQKLNGNWHCFR